MKYSINKTNHCDFDTVEIGRLSPRAYFIPEKTRREKSAADYKSERYNSSMVQVLSGKWDFKYYKSKSKLPSVLDTGKVSFDRIDVPSTWQHKGYEPPVYLNCPYQFNDVTPPELPGDFSAGVYRKSFRIADAAKKHIITFLGVVPSLDLYVNGKFVGYGEAAHNSYEFDITPYLEKGENELVAVLFKWSNGTFLEAQDMFRENGIFRDVYITEYPDTYINDFVVTTPKQGKLYSLCGDVFVEGDCAGCKIKAELFDGKKKVAGVTLKAEAVTKFSFPELSVSEWNAEEPYLYELFITLEKGKDELMSLRNYTGFRTIKIDGPVFTFNGKKIKLKGVNHHDTHPVKGYALSFEDLERDIKLMKEFNVNCVRTSHYPPDPQFLILAAHYGLYVVDEADIETHGLPELGFPINFISQDLKWAPRYLDRVKRMYFRDRNCPAVLMWSLGNESEGYKCQDKCYEYLHSVCPQIPVHYEGVSRTKRYHYDVYSEMYTDVYSLEKVKERTRGKQYENVPFYLCEYCHAMGVGPGALEEYWDMFYSDDIFMGGCIWEWADHSVKHSKKEKDYRYEYTYGGDHGEKKHDGNFCVDGLFYPDRTPHTGAYEMKAVYRPVRASHVKGMTFSLFNTNRFRNASYLEVYWELKKDGVVDECGSFSIDIAPEKSAKYTLACAKPEGGHTYHVAFTYLDGDFAVASEEIELARADTLHPDAAKGKISVTSDNGALTVKYADGAAAFDEKTGVCTSYSFGGKQLLNKSFREHAGFLPNVYRAALDNDRNFIAFWENTLKLNSLEYRLTSLECEVLGGIAEIEAEYDVYGCEKLFECELTYIIGANGVMNIKGSFALNEDAENVPYDIPRFGITFEMPAAFSEVTYFGRGERENLPDMKAQSLTGVYTEKIADMHEPYIKPQDNGNRTEVRYLGITDGKAALTVYSDELFSFSAHNYTESTLVKSRHREDVKNEGTSYISVDSFMRGTGTASCGPDALDKYKADPSEGLAFNFTLVPEIKK